MFWVPAFSLISLHVQSQVVNIPNFFNLSDGTKNTWLSSSKDVAYVNSWEKIHHAGLFL
jgi:hypothetical protein